jgi:hypothetical protein
MTEPPKPVRVMVHRDGVVSPCIVMPSRYGGTYEGGKWLAFPLDEIPEGPFWGDPWVPQWFGKNDWWVGVADSPTEAVEDLVRRLEAAEVSGRAVVQRPDWPR